jgi:hypothetical protein
MLGVKDLRLNLPSVYQDVWANVAFQFAVQISSERSLGSP